MSRHVLVDSKQRVFLSFWAFILFALPVRQAGFAKAYSQSTTSQDSSKELINSNISYLDITLRDHIALHIVATTSQSIKISESHYGEYQQAVMLSSSQRHDTLFITDPKNPTFTYPNDKLSAHKIIDGTATIYMPQGKTIFISAESADVTLTGAFHHVTVNLKNGKCRLQDVHANFQVVTVYAPVYVRAPKTRVNATSKNGIVTRKSLSKNARYQGKVESINGTITIE